MASEYDYVGGSVGICNDGSRYVVASPGINLKTFRRYMNDTKTDETDINNGYVTVYDSNGETRIDPPEKVTGPEKKDRFGTCTRISGDGNTIAIGSYNAERVYVYRYNDGDWDLQYQLIPNQRTKVFGYNLWISGDGNDIVVGAPEVPSRFHDYADGAYESMGAVFHYRNGELLHQVMPCEPDENRTPEHYGRAVWLSDDAETLMIGSMGSATVYEFAYFKNDWVQTDLIRQDLGTDFGNSISRDGDDYLIGAKNGNFAMLNDTRIEGGAAFGGSVKYRHGQIVAGSFQQFEDWFGYSVDIFPNGNVLVGSPLWNRTGRFQILTPTEARDAGLYCEEA